MFTKLFIAFLLSLFFNFAYAQNFDEKYLAHWIKISGQSSLTKSNSLFVVDGTAYQKTDSAFLKTIPVKNIAGLFIFPDTSSNFHMVSDLIIVRTKGSQSKKEKRKYLLQAQTKFVDNYLGFSSHILVESKDPVLMIDDNTVHSTESKLAISKLKLRDIYAITV